MSNERVELILNNVTFGVLNRINASLSNYLKIDDYVYKKNTHSIIINNIEVLEEAKKIINSVDEKIVITEKVLKNIYRYIFYLENLDCANCGAKVERLCTKNIIADKVVVDFPTLKIIIETTKDYDEKELQLLIQECAEMVDPRIEVKKSLNKKVTEEFKIDPKKKKVFIIGLVIFLVFFIAKTIIKYVFNIDELWVVIMIYIGYLPAYFLLSKEILLGALKNLKNARFFDEMFLMTLATIMALVVQYYDEAIFIIIFYRIGELCQQYAINYSRKSIAELTKIKVEKAMVEINGQKVEMDAEGIVVGDILYINSGERIALDGVVEEGTALLDNKALTGESIPVEVKAGTEVVSGAICLDGTIKVKVTKTYENSMVAKILGVVENASLSKSKSETVTPQGIIGICNYVTSRENFEGNVLVLDGLQDPGNIGTLIRTAICFDFNTIYITDNSCDIYNEKVLRATQGGIFKVNIIRKNINDIIDDLKKKGYYIVGTSLKNGIPLNDINFKNLNAIILGNEGNGVSKETIKLSNINAYIPINTSMESLNVAIAGGIIMNKVRN